jgi:hypothetical protein
MKTLKIEADIDTPEVILDSKSNIFSISGRSLPEDCVEFYTPILNWINLYRKSPNQQTELVLKMDYMNTATTKFIQDILEIIENINGAKVVWCYDDQDEDMEDLGIEFSELVSIPFELKKFSTITSNL